MFRHRRLADPRQQPRHRGARVDERHRGGGIPGDALERAPARHRRDPDRDGPFRARLAGCSGGRRVHEWHALRSDHRVRLRGHQRLPADRCRSRRRSPSIRPASDIATAKPILTKDLTLTAGQRYTVAATNELAKIEANVLTDDPAPTADKAQVRIVHLSADTGGVDILPSGKDVALFSGVTYPNATDYKTVDPGVASIDVRNTGTTTVALDVEPHRPAGRRQHQHLRHRLVVRGGRRAAAALARRGR